MGESGKFSLINLGDVSKPATVLIEKISDAVGGLYQPFQIRRIARAEADADKIRAAARIEITELEHRAMSRLFAEEAKKQHNMEAITLKALPDISPEARTEDVEDDWIANFFDKCRLISDEQMQSLWARILAGEANSPGKFSKRTVNIVASLDKSDAILFSRACSFVFMFGSPVPLVFDVNLKIYNDAGINFSSLTHLESAGLVHFDGFGEYKQKGLRQKEVANYFGLQVSIEFLQRGVEFPRQSENRLHVGHVIFTKAGEELAPLAGGQPQAGFMEFVKEYWKRYGIEIEF
jgi:hypothetical protein